MLVIYLLLILMIIIWSFSFIVVDIAVDYTSPLSLALYRCVISSISFLIIDLYLKLNKKLNNQYKELNKVKFTNYDWILIILASLTGISFFYFIQYNAIKLIGPSLPALFVCLLAPVLVSILALIFYEEHLNKFKIIGFIIASIGSFFLITGGNIKNLMFTSPNFLGYLLALFTPLLWAIYATATKKITKEKSTYKILKYIVYFGTFELLILVIISGEIYLFFLSFFNIIILLCGLYLGLASFILGSYIWQTSQKELKSSKVASFLYIQPFFTLFFSFLLQRSEVIVIWNIIGGIIVLFSVLIINYKEDSI